MARRRGSSASPSSATASSDRVTARPRDLLVSVLVKRMKATVRLRRLALFAAADVPSALAAVQSGAAVFNPKTITLGNGLQVVLVENHRSEEHTTELQSLMRITHAVLRLNKKHKHVIH